ncbi:unnamed protein product [Medioppia subpectinata]|uniref:Zinc finger protein 593 homolog n=1 Tax=Medioppia subpectinata TaxID=1979941 RepID=A0A7R9KLD3_9ACAR|nr:unnamed protein product [Medioppia subpectinata]CAG2105750.1 unnamed protein product [Medioppia subpectinata]
MTRYSRKKGKNPPNRRIGKRGLKMRTYKKDLDLIQHQLSQTIAAKDNEDNGVVVVHLPKTVVTDGTVDDGSDVDYDLPANGQFQCRECARYFIDDKAMRDHNKSKAHKKRLKLIRDEPYSQEEAERASGMGSYVSEDMHKRGSVNKRQHMETD